VENRQAQVFAVFLSVEPGLLPYDWLAPLPFLPIKTGFLEKCYHPCGDRLIVPGLMERHSPFDSQPFGGVTGAGHDAPLSPVMMGFPRNSGWMASSQDGKKGVAAQMDDGPGLGVKRKGQIVH